MNMRRTFVRSGADSAIAYDPAEKIFQAADDSVVQVGKDYILYSLEGKDAAREEDRTFFKDLDCIKVIRSRRSGSITAIRYKTKGEFGALEINGFEIPELEEIARLLETRAGSFPVKFLVKSGDPSRWGVLIIIGLGALVATACSGGFLYYSWMSRDQLSGIGETRPLLAVLCILSLAATLVAWMGFWRNLRK